MEIIDYAKPLISAETALRDMYNDTLENKYESAYNHGFKAIAEIRMAMLAIKHQQERQAK